MSSTNQLLRDVLVRTGASQARLSRLSGIPEGRISEYVRDKQTPSVKQLDRLLRPLELTVSLAMTPLHDGQSRDVEELYRERGKALERVAAIAMALPRRDAGPLRFPPFRTVIGHV